LTFWILGVLTFWILCARLGSSKISPMRVFKKLGADTLIFGLLSCPAQEGKIVFVVSLDGPFAS
jgi:hypothetical protein